MPLSESMRKHNLEIMRRRMTMTENTLVDDECMAVLKELGQFVLSWIEDKRYTYENETYNLTDSTGCGVYKKGVLVSFFYAPKQAAIQKHFVWEKRGMDMKFFGRDLLQQALNGQGTTLAAASTYSLQVFSMAPYGVFVNDGTGNRGKGSVRGRGWFNNLKAETEKKFQEIKAARNGTHR